MRFCSLGSGSRGNAHIVEKGNTTLLIECGFSHRTLKKRLLERYLSPLEINAVFISHEHSDHVAGLKFFIEHNIPYYMSAGTARALAHPPNWRCLAAGEQVMVGELSIEAIPVAHDVSEPMQFIIEDGVRKLAIFTDLGHISRNVLRACHDADALMVECNYDDEMLARGNYPTHIKERIAGDYGHLSNSMASQLIAATKRQKPRHIIAAHISAENNNETLVRRALKTADENATIHIASQSHGTDWIQL